MLIGTLVLLLFFLMAVTGYDLTILPYVRYVVMPTQTEVAFCLLQALYHDCKVI